MGKQPFSTRISQEALAIARRIGKAERRSVTSALECAVIEYAERRGILSAEEMDDDDVRAIASRDDRETARQRLEILRPLLDDPERTRAMAAAVAHAAGVNVSTIYGWLRLYESGGSAVALVPNKRGRKAGSTRIDAATEKIVTEAIRMADETPGLRPAAVIRRVDQGCREAGIKPPHPNTIRNRLKRRPP